LFRIFVEALGRRKLVRLHACPAVRIRHRQSRHGPAITYLLRRAVLHPPHGVDRRARAFLVAVEAGDDHQPQFRGRWIERRPILDRQHWRLASRDTAGADDGRFSGERGDGAKVDVHAGSVRLQPDRVAKTGMDARRQREPGADRDEER
jgi:hypothetical protein